MLLLLCCFQLSTEFFSFGIDECDVIVTCEHRRKLNVIVENFVACSVILAEKHAFLIGFLVFAFFLHFLLGSVGECKFGLIYDIPANFSFNFTEKTVDGFVHVLFLNI